MDSSEIGRLAEGDLLRQEIATGSHIIEAQIDWCGSQPLQVEAGSEDLTILVTSATRGWRVFWSVFYVAFKRRNYLDLKLTGPELQADDTSVASHLLASFAERRSRHGLRHPSIKGSSHR